MLGAKAAGHRAPRATPSFLWVLVGGRVSGLAEEGIARLEVPGQPVYRLSHPRLAPQCSDGDAHWQTGSSTSQSMADTQWRWGMGWSPWASQQAQPVDRAWGGIVLQSTTLRSSQEASGLVRESFPEAALVPGCGPDVCNIWSTQASDAIETPPRVAGLTVVFVSPQVPCRLRAARSRTKASTSVWRPTPQAHATRLPPTCMCEVRTQAVPSPDSTELSCPRRACCPEPWCGLSGLPWAQSLLLSTSFCSSRSSSSSHWASS